MRRLFDIDKKDYAENYRARVRNSSRAIIIKQGKVALMHSAKYGYYKFPGGGIEEGESNVDALIREVAEEAGLVVIPKSIKEYGMVHRIQRDGDAQDAVFIQDNYYYLCDVEDTQLNQRLDYNEREEGFTLVWSDVDRAIELNDECMKNLDAVVLQRDTRVLRLIKQELCGG